MRDYGSVHTCFWTHPQIQSLSGDGKLLALYLLTGPHSNMLGCFRLSAGYVADDLGWSFEIVTKEFKELGKIGFATYDEDHKWVLIHHFLKWNPIENPNQGKSLERFFEQIPKNSMIFQQLITILLKNNKHLGERFHKRLATLAQVFRNQDQDQEQDQERIFMSGRPNPDVMLSNESDVEPPPLLHIAEPKPKKQTQLSKQFKTQALEVLEFLNEKTGRAYRPLDTNLKLIMARLQTGATVMDCRQVIAKKTREWKRDAKMAEYLRPATLFNATKFEQYLGELVVIEEDEVDAAS